MEVLYTVPAGRRAQVRHVHISNPGGVPQPLTLGVNFIYWLENYPVPAGAVLDFRHDTEWILNAGEELLGAAGNGTIAILTIDGIEIPA